MTSGGARLRGGGGGTRSDGSSAASSSSSIAVRRQSAAAVRRSLLRLRLPRRVTRALIVSLALVTLLHTLGWLRFGGDDGAALDDAAANSNLLSPGEDKMLRAAAATPPSPLVDQEHLLAYMRHADSHVLMSTDRLAFAEMGFQTATYARVLRAVQQRQLGADVLLQFEKTLWSFVPGLAKIRAAQGLTADGEGGNNSTRGWQKVIDKAIIKPLQARSGSSHRRRPPVRSSSRGVIMTVGSGHFTYAAQLIATIREAHRCDIPIEIYYYGQADLPADMRAFLERSYADVKTIDLAEQGLFAEKFCGIQNGGWAIKPYALLATNFSEVMLLDADSVLLADPHDFFREQGYRATGTLFFHDRLLPDWHNHDTVAFVHEQIGRRGPLDGLANSLYLQHNLSHYQESGLVVLNKAFPDVLAALLLTAWQNARPVRDAITYKLFHGDKETYWFAHELARLPYHFSRHWAGAIGPEHAAHRKGFCADHQLHFFDAPRDDDDDAEARTLTVEASTGRPAWFNGSLLKNKLHGSAGGKGDVLDMHDSIWAMDGDWEFVVWDGGSTFCLRNYTRNGMHDLRLLGDDTLRRILRIARQASARVDDFFDEQGSGRGRG